MSGALRVGVFGLRRGLLLARNCRAAGMTVVAVCERDVRLLRAAAESLGAVAYEDYGDFLAHDMDGVVLANHFDEHAPSAIQALAAGKHVMSETAACRTLAEGVALVRAVERSGRIYLFAENYPFKPHVLEMRRRFAAGEVGTFQYGECEYLHAFSPQAIASFHPDPAHWRARITSTSYCSHSIAPVMYVTDTLPCRVSAFVVRAEDGQTVNPWRGLAAVMMIRMNDGALMKSLHGFLQGEQSSGWSWLRIHGTHGLLENLRHGNAQSVRIRKEAWTTLSGQVEDVVVTPTPVETGSRPFPEERSDDFLVCESFATAMRTGAQPYFDVYRGVAASIVGICGLRSLLREGTSIDVPDFRDASVCRQYESDDDAGY